MPHDVSLYFGASVHIHICRGMYAGTSIFPSRGRYIGCFSSQIHQITPLHKLNWQVVAMATPPPTLGY